MASYKYLSIHYTGGGDQLEVYCTDKTTLDWLVSEVQKYCPRVKIRDSWKLPNGETCYYLFEKANVKTSFGEMRTQSIRVWLIKQLLEQGWEPFGEPYYGFPTSLVMRG